MYRANELSVVFEKVPWVGIKPKNLRSVETLTGNRPSNALSSSLSTSQSRVHVTSNPAKLQTSSRSRSSVVSMGSLALMRVDNWWPGLTFYVPFPGQPQGTSRRGKSSDAMGAVRNVRPVFSTIEADVHAQEPRGNHLVLVQGWCITHERYPGPSPSDTSAHVSPPSWVMQRLPWLFSGSSQLPPMANPVDASAKERANAPVMDPPCTTGSVVACHVCPASSERNTLETAPPVTTQTVSPAEAMLPLDAANAASPWTLSGSALHGNLDQD